MMTMNTSQDEVVIESEEITLILRYTDFAVLAFLLYDITLLLDAEVQHFLTPPKKALSYLYFITRYSGILYTTLELLTATHNASTVMLIVHEAVGVERYFLLLYTDPNIKGNLYYLLCLVEVMLVLCIDYILLLRVRALYSKEKVITIILSVAFAAEVTSGLAFALQSAITLRPQPMPIAPGFIFCSISAPSLLMSVVSWTIPLIYGVLLMIFAVYKSAKILKEEPGLNASRMIKIIVRDQIVYFMALIFISAGTIMGNFIQTTGVLVISQTLGNTAILSSVGARLLLNMKEAGARGLNEGMGSGASKVTVSGMDFAQPFAQASTFFEEDAVGRIEEIGMIEV